MKICSDKGCMSPALEALGLNVCLNHISKEELVGRLTTVTRNAREMTEHIKTLQKHLDDLGIVISDVLKSK